MTVNLNAELERAKTELAAGKHTPSKAVVTMAKRGLAAAKSRTDVPADSVAAGRKIASGAQLSSDQVKTMADFHAAHEYDCNADDTTKGCEDMLWGGAPGAAWSAARAAAIDISTLSEDAVELGADDDLSLEIFVRHNSEPVELADEDGLIWAPILRSGTHATRPGPYGSKLLEPLVIVPGRASDPSKEIGLENLLENFRAGAVQHVTIPSTHDNGVLDNNGFIVDLRIDDSVKRPGERVLMGAHKITEPDVLGRLERGSIANRSCGILHNYVDTETGAQYDQVLEHVALTNKPWIRGMAAYGDLSDVDLSERQVVPMLLSELPATTELADTVSDGSWNGDASRFSDTQYSRSCLVDRKNGKPAKERCSLPVREPDGTLNRAAVHAAAGRIASLGDVTAAQKRAAAQKLLSLYRGPLKEQPPINLIKLAAASTSMSEVERRHELFAEVEFGDKPSFNQIRSSLLNQLDSFAGNGYSDEPSGPYYSIIDLDAEKALIRCEYGMDFDDDAWVVPYTTDNGDVKLADFAQWTPVTREWVTDDDAAADKDELAKTIGPGGIPESTPFDALSERSQLLQAPPERHNQQGGAAMPTMKEQLDRLELSDEAKAVVQQLAQQNEQMQTQLAETRREARKTAVASRVKDLQDKGFAPGFLAVYETIALGDDGAVAAVLNLSEGGTARSVEQTATELCDRLIEAMPFDDSGRLALASAGNLVTSPIGSRSPVDGEDANNIDPKAPKTPATSDDLLSEWEQAAPGLTGSLFAEPSSTSK